MTTHSKTHFLPYKAGDLYALVTEVERYPEFLPWCAALRVLKREDERNIFAEMLVRYKSFTEKFISRVTMNPQKSVRVELVEGPFHHLINEWEFTPREGGTEVRFFIDFALKSSVLQSLLGYFFESAFNKMVTAFEKRAAEVCRKSE